MPSLDKKGDRAKFVVRGTHMQHPGYANWPASVLDKMYVEPTTSARDLVERSACYMRDRNTRLWKEIFNNAMSGGNITQYQDLRYVYGPAAVPEYGDIDPGREHFWAEAASADLESFKANFLKGIFFDNTISSSEILDWQQQHMRATPPGVPVRAIV